MTNEALKKLIDEPNCGFNCPPDNPFSCGCSGCIKQVARCWGDGTERLERFTEQEIKQIDEMKINDDVGYLGKNGCILPRKYRPLDCLTSICNYAKRFKNDLN